jgi:pimeloyl-ACP methyl ester carboxylesterase
MKLNIVSRYPDTTPKFPPLLFLHGSFTDARVWDEYFLKFYAKNGYAAHALSLRGHGNSEGHENLHSWRLEDYVKDLAQATADMPQPPVLIGHSMGGMVVQKYLEQSPTISGVVLMASVPPRGLLLSNLYMAMLHPFLFNQMVMLSVLGPNYGSIDMMRRLLFSADISMENLHKFSSYAQSESRAVSIDMMGLNPLRLDQKQIKSPFLVLGAQHDVLVSPTLVLGTAKFYNAECHIFPNMAHAMMLESNWQIVAAYLLSWIDQVTEA